MDQENGGGHQAPARPPKILSHIHNSRVVYPLNTSLSPTNSRKEHQQIQQNQQQNLQQQERQNSSNLNKNSGNNIRNNTISSNINSNNFHHTIDSVNINNTTASNISFNNNLSHSSQINTPLIQLQSQQQHPPNTTNNLSSTTNTLTNSFSRRRPPPITLPLLPSISSNIVHNSESSTTPVTLAVPRPENERLSNEYVDTPFRTVQQLHQASRHQHPAGQIIHGQTTTQHNLLLSQRQQNKHSNNSSIRHQTNNNAVVNGSRPSNIGESISLVAFHSNSNHKSDKNTSSFESAQTTTLLPSEQTQMRQISINRPSVLPITKQPTTFPKDVPSSVLHDDFDQNLISSTRNMGDTLNSITCPQCKKCRCEQCQSPRQLPSKWVCNKTCFCSAETVIDYVSCLCCVKALFYHCAKDHEMECDDGDNISCADDPCSCLSHKRAARWGWLCALSLALPCLWCYWPMRGCVAICAKCYARRSRHGCRCRSIDSTVICPKPPINNTISGIKSVGRGDIHHNSISDNSGNHCLTNSGINSSNTEDITIIRPCDFTSEKRLLNTTSEY